jgi:hypothetical protein
MGNRSEFGRAGPLTRILQSWAWRPAAVFSAVALVVVACTEDTKPITAPSNLGGPNFGESTPENAGNKCLAADAFLSKFTNGVRDSLKLADITKSCTAQDVKVASADVDSISFDLGVNYVAFDPTKVVTCNETDQLFLKMKAHVKENATSERTDIGVWIGLNGSNGRTGSCNHYNLVSKNIPVGGNANGVYNIDGDKCGDMNNASEAIVPLGIIQATCKGATAADTLVHIGSCVGWTQPGGDQVCPTSVGGDNGFRFGTTPGTTSKCNCDGFDIPITIAKVANLEVNKVCSPVSINGATFDLLIDGSNQFADNVGCGGTTGKQELGAGTSRNPGKTYSFAEGDFGGGFAAADYTSSFKCVNRTGGAVRVAETAGTGPGNITLQPNDDVICTFTNVLKPKIKVVKDVVPNGDLGKFDFTIGGVLDDNGGAGYGDNGATAFKTRDVGPVTISEAGHTGTTLGDYASTLTCKDAGDVTRATTPASATTSGSVQLNAGDVITCTFTNTKGASLKLVKKFVPTGDAGRVDFTMQGYANFTNGGNGFANDGTTGAQTVPINASLNFGEVGHTGTSLTNYTTTLSCKDALGADYTFTPGAGNTTGSLTPTAGSAITCTFTNTRIPVLKLVKQFAPTTDAGKVDFSIAGYSTFTGPGGNGFGHNGETGFQKITIGGTGTAFSEAGHTGTSLGDYDTALACSNQSGSVAANPGTGNTSGTVTAAAGDSITCTFTNTRKPQVKLVKDFIPDADAGRVNLKIETTTYDNGGGGFADGGTTGFKNVTAGSVAIAELANGTTNLSEYVSSLSCVDDGTTNARTVSPNNKTSGTITGVVAGDKIVCTFVNDHRPKLSINKVPKANTDTVTAGETAEFTITVSAASDGGAAVGVVLRVTLASGLNIPGTNLPQKGWTSDQPTKCSFAAYPTGPAGDLRVMTCNVGTLAPGASFVVKVSAVVPSSFLFVPPVVGGTTIEIDSIPNGADVDPDASTDWASLAAGVNCVTQVKCHRDTTGTTDNSFGQGTKEDSPVPTIVSGSIPPNKSDLLRFYVNNANVQVTSDSVHHVLYLAWRRVQAPSGTTNMDFELNQLSTLSANGVTPVRKAGDVLIKYDLSNGGTKPTIGFHTWIESGTCEASGAKPPCWSVGAAVPSAKATINTSAITDPILPLFNGGNVDALTFGEAAIDLERAGIFKAGECKNFGSAYLKSRSSDSFTAEIKDFVSPEPISITSCPPQPIPNVACVSATNFTPTGGILGGPLCSNGEIQVVKVPSSLLNSPVIQRLAQVQAGADVAVGSVIDHEAIAVSRRAVVLGASQSTGAPWPPRVASQTGAPGGGRVQVRTASSPLPA